jgi:hypothetical protein
MVFPKMHRVKVGQPQGAAYKAPAVSGGSQEGSLSQALRCVWLAVGMLLLPACGGGGGGTSDTTAPIIGSLAVTPELITPGVEVRISAQVTDIQSGVQAVTAVVTYPDNTQTTVQLRADGSGVTYTGTFTAQWVLTSANSARVVLQAVDGAGNRSSRTQTIRTVAAPPSPPF